jgi:hypothetical protein
MFRAFWDVAPWSHVEVDRRLGGAYCLRHQGDEDGGSAHLWNVGQLQRDYEALYPSRLLNFILAAVRTWNLTRVM